MVKANELKAGTDARKGSASGTAKLESDARGGSGAILPDFANLVQILHPSNGRNEVIIVQSGVDHIVPAARSLLEGDPVYTLYLNVGWTREWVMHFCVPRVAPVGPRQVGGVVSLSSPPELKAPFAILTKVPPQRLVPPEVIVPGALKPKPSPMVLYGYLDEKGKFSRMKKDGADPSGLGDKVLKSLDLWELRPATRGGGPTRVQIILVVPVD